MNPRFLVPGVDSTTPLSAAAPAILATKAAPLFQLEGAARSGADADAVHDMRVASRRLREAWRLFSPLYDESASAGWFASIRRVTRTLGPVRDSDVFIEAFSELCEGIGEGGRRAIAFLVGHRLGQRERQLEELNAELARLDLGRARKQFAKLTRTVAKSAHSQRPLADFAHAAVAERAAVVFGLQPDALAEENVSLQHALRIDYKRLRYAVEALAPCYGDEFDAIHAVLTAFQDALGDLHDRHLFLDLVAAIESEPAARHAGVSEGDFAEVRQALDAAAREAFERFTRLVAENPPEAMLGALLLPLTRRPQAPAAEEAPTDTAGDAPAPEADAAPEATPDVFALAPGAPAPEADAAPLRAPAFVAEVRVLDGVDPVIPYISETGDLVMPAGDLALGPWTAEGVPEAGE